MIQELKIGNEENLLLVMSGSKRDSYGRCHFCNAQAKKCLYAEKEKQVIAFNLCESCACKVGHELTSHCESYDK